MTIHLGISTCPNDTFAFHGILTGQVDRRGLDFRIELLDVEELNRRLLEGDFDVAKASFHAALAMGNQVGVLPVGSALGFGVGPLLLAAPAGLGRPPAEPVVLCPGAHTTATLLYRLFHPGEGVVRQVVFSEIMPALVRGAADLGVCIHEGRFTYQGHGLRLVEDLGTRWEEATGGPLPLGGIVARRRLGADTIGAVIAVIRDSLDLALADRSQALETMRRYAQELADDVILAHVDLYVNELTRDLGATGIEALAQLTQRAIAVGAVEVGSSALEVLGSSEGEGPPRP